MPTYTVYNASNLQVHRTNSWHSAYLYLSSMQRRTGGGSLEVDGQELDNEQVLSLSERTLQGSPGGYTHYRQPTDDELEGVVSR